MDALSTEISITGLTFKTTPLSTSFTPLIDSRNDASRLAMSFLQRYNTSAAATSTHSSTLASASAPIIRLGFTSDLPSVHTEPIPGTYTSALANFCRATGKEEPEYTFKELDAGLGYSACVKVAKTEFWGDSNVVIGKKNIAKEYAAKVND
ncbi:hypothetical protein HDU99_002769 [Rhizoclosmatium hyalinum]|nr:hypothetical protein HDU99_002769 [Rhizoclosmatium hyalinum]